MSKIKALGVPKIKALGLGNTESAENRTEAYTINDLVQDAYWVDIKTRKKTNLMDLRDNKIWFVIKFKKNAIGKTFKAQIGCLSSPKGVTNIGVSIIDKEEIFLSYDLQGEDFKNLSGNIQKFYYILKTENDRTGKTYPLSQNDYLRVHIIRYVPQILQNQKPAWEVSARTQYLWFDGNPNEKPWRNDPVLDFVSMEWILGFERMREFYNNEIMQKWNNDNAVKLLKQRIKEQTTDPEVNLKLPVNIGDKVKFGVFDKKLKDYPNIEQPKLNGKKDNEIIPIFEKFYCQNLQYKISKIPPENSDDLLGAFASCQFRIIAAGEIKKVDISKYEINIIQIGVYMKDSFDFITSDEYLGDWSLIANDIMKNPYFTTFKNYYAVKNVDYRNYRKDYNKGGDYNIYSSIKTENVSFKFEASETEIK